LPIHNGLRSIQSHYESYAAADMLNRNFARGIGFARDGVSLSWAGHVTLGQVAKRLRRQPAVRLSIGVHTDARGDVQANLGLTQKRADAIKNRLIELGVAADRLQAIGYGDTLPIADNNAPVGRALNRRVVFSPK
ncbi:MAG: OmpA family protein, partial [Gammaproteobacteria bacterium]|nr:OmpA family protein [Gammaproteobacteria bacterium]